MKKAVETAGSALPKYKYFTGFDGVTMKTLNPPDVLKQLKPAGAKGIYSSLFFL